MNCKDVQAALLDYLDHSLDAASHAGMKKHLETCEKCRLDVKEWGDLLQAMVDAGFEKPGPALRESFHSLLQSELNLQATAGILEEDLAKRKLPLSTAAIVRKTDPPRLKMGSPVWKVAAAFILLAGGIWIGTRWKSSGEPAPADQITALSKEVKEMKEVLLFSLLDDESASQRLKAVSYAEDISNPDQKVIDALVNTLNNDKNVNVRLASLYSLARFSDNAAVRDSLVASLGRQTEPIIQVVLINMLAEKKETRAIAPIREILSRDKTLKEVKEAAQKSLKIM
jgi:putative zinc finger protein/HEAT repeat protein